MFYGSFEHTLDDKFRLMIPVKFRVGLAGGVCITPGLDHCLYLFPQAEWEQFALKVRQLPLTKKPARSFARFFLGGAESCEMDKQGRVLLPASLRQHANITGSVIGIGMDNRIELWNPEAYRQEHTEVAEDVDSLAEGLSDLGVL
jgi:MraZ protein